MSSSDPTAGQPSAMNAASFAVILGVGSAGLTWAEVVGELGEGVLAAPDELEIPPMAAGLDSAVADLPRPRVPIDASMWPRSASPTRRTGRRSTRRRPWSCGGALDSAVPLEAHIELALRCGGGSFG